jgi:hypothetical protein
MVPDIKDRPQLWRKNNERGSPEQSKDSVFVGFPERRKNFRTCFINTPCTSPILGAPEQEAAMNDWETDWSRDVLERIVALLFALAGLADRAAGLPFLRRRHVLGILSRGEAEARAFLIGASTGVPVPADGPGEIDGAPERICDAARLAARLRALALLLCAMLANAALFALPGAAGPRTCRPSLGISGPAFRWLRAPAPSAPDTS